MKALDSPLRLFVLLLFVVLGISGCQNVSVGPENEKQNQARSEKDFVDNYNLRATPISVIALNLEDLNSPRTDSIPDTGTWGEDIVYIRYMDNVVRTFRMETTARFSVFMVNVETGTSLFYLDWNNPYIQVNIPAGDYRMQVHSWLDFVYDSTSGKQTIFIKPDNSDASYTIFTLAGCKDCDLSNANLDHLDLSHMNFSAANFSKANISSANLSGSEFTNTNFENAYLYKSVIKGSDFSNSLLKGVVLRNSDLTYSSFSNCDLSYADLRFSDISNGTFCGANKTGILTNGLIYNGGTQCWP